MISFYGTFRGLLRGLRSLALLVVTFIFLTCYSALAFAQTATSTATGVLPPVDPGDALNLVTQIIEAGKSGQWLWVVAGVLMLAVWVLKTFVMKKINPKHLIYWSVGMGVAGAVATTLATAVEGDSMVSIILKAVGLGVTAGLAAGGVWSAGGKKVLPNK